MKRIKVFSKLLRNEFIPRFKQGGVESKLEHAEKKIKEQPGVEDIWTFITINI